LIFFDKFNQVKLTYIPSDLKYIDEYRDINVIDSLAADIHAVVSNSWNIMDICGGQTHSILKYNLTEFLPSQINIVHGPGCPVCVTSLEKIDKALAISKMKDVILISYADMLRVISSVSNLIMEKSQGADIRMVYSPLDAVKIAVDNPHKKVVFFATGFEATAPGNALSVKRAKQLGLNNYFILSSQVLVPPAIKMLLGLKGLSIQGFLAPGLVCSVTGYSEYYSIASKFKVPIVITGLEPADIMKGMLEIVRHLENGRTEVVNEFRRAVSKEGNQAAIAMIYEIFERTDQEWRGIGIIPESGLKVRAEYSEFDAEMHFNPQVVTPKESGVCIAGRILQGISKPTDCKAFSIGCIPEHTLGAPMVSPEGVCAAYYHYQ